MEAQSLSAGNEIDLNTCDREPIHVPSSIQPHGMLLVLDENELSVLQASDNVGELVGLAARDALGQPLAKVIGDDAFHSLKPRFRSLPQRERPLYLATLLVGARSNPRPCHAIAHKNEAGIILELELASANDPLPATYPLVDAYSIQAEEAKSVDELCRTTAEALRRLTEFDRVLIYRFDQDWNGTVVGEAGNGRLPSLLHHRFPASDIPAQARELYRVNRVRLIPDSGYRPVPIVPAIHPRTGAPLDMTFSALRSVSPVHVEYMRNMETASSMSISILREGKLWGLVSCHHKEPKAVTYSVRLTCDLFARAFSLRLAALEQSEELQGRIQVRSTLIRLLAAMADQTNFATALHEHNQETLRFVNASGAAVLTDNGCVLIGETPSEAEVRAVAEWLFTRPGQEVFQTDSLPALFAPAAAYKEKGCGLLAIAVSKIHPSFVFWFRPETVRTIKWGGDPRKPVAPESEGTRLHPRRSFETWLETVRDKSLPWRTSEVEGAVELRNAIVGIVLRRVEEMAQLNAELTRSNKELEAFSYSVSHDLRAPLRHIVGYAEILREPAAADLKPRGERCVRTIIESAEYAGMLVDKLLAFSRMGRSQLQMSKVDMNVLLREMQREAAVIANGRKIRWAIGPLPAVHADLMMLREAIRNLIDNAIKYTRNKEEAVIEVGSREDENEHVFWVRDNGVGFDQQYAGKLFGVFQRLHRMEDYEGTGIGLANVRRVMERHGGQTWAEGEEEKGATFYFTLPKTATGN